MKEAILRTSGKPPILKDAVSRVYGGLTII